MITYIMLAGEACARCGRPAEELHHIDRNNKNNAADNQVFLCKLHHGIEHGQPTRDSIERASRIDTIKSLKASGMTLAEVGQKMHLSRSRIGAILQSAK